MRRLLLSVLALAVFAALVALGSWQLQRRVWKLALIEQVEQRLQAAPVAAPGPDGWAAIGKADAYRRVELRGLFHHELETCTQALSELGAGCWVMTPLRTEAGWWVLVNRGFVAPDKRDPASRAVSQPQGVVTVTGLLRLSEPLGGFLRRNLPAEQRWYSRDVAAIGAARGLPAPELAPYFVDAAETVAGGPVGGLTVIRFPNNHLVYALTWFGLALLPLLGLVLIWRKSIPSPRLRGEG